jgi:hypothetical protein
LGGKVLRAQRFGIVDSDCVVLVGLGGHFSVSSCLDWAQMDSRSISASIIHPARDGNPFLTEDRCR